jgi:hypothetical protein
MLTHAEKTGVTRRVGEFRLARFDFFQSFTKLNLSASCCLTTINVHLLPSLVISTMSAANIVTLEKEKDSYASAHIDQSSFEGKGDEESFSDVELAQQAAAAAADKTLLRKVSLTTACGILCRSSCERLKSY